MHCISTETVDLASQMARAAGTQIRTLRGHTAGRLKGFRDFVSEADLAAESVIINTIRSRFPHHNILSEESGADVLTSSEYCWIIDPLDGTKNYLWGIPFSCVSIALAFQGQVRLGVVYDPWRDEMFYGWAGHGVYLNGKRVRVTEHTRLSESLVATDYGYTPQMVELSAELSKRVQSEVAGLRAFGSAALVMAYVACGRLDAYFSCGLYTWDVAASGFLVTEAGGVTTDLTGKPKYLEAKNCLTTNGLIHDELLKKLAVK